MTVFSTQSKKKKLPQKPPEHFLSNKLSESERYAKQCSIKPITLFFIKLLYLMSLVEKTKTKYLT